MATNASGLVERENVGEEEGALSHYCKEGYSLLQIESLIKIQRCVKSFLVRKKFKHIVQVMMSLKSQESLGAT